MDFLLVPDELKHAAASCAAWLQARGWTVNDADDDLSFPSAPSMSARRGSALLVVEILSELDDRRLAEWLLYGKAQGDEFRFAVCIDSLCDARIDIVAHATNAGLGVYIVEGGATREMTQARDLSATTIVPDLAGEEQWVREALGGAIEEYERGEWQDGLRSATRGLEELSRRRLAQLLSQGTRFAPVTGRKTPPKLAGIERAALGRIGIFFSMVEPATAESSTLVRVIDVIRDPRNDLSHKNDTPKHRTSAVKLLYVILRGARELQL